MYNARQPAHASALMHGWTPLPARQFNAPIHDSNLTPHFSSFTSRQSHSQPVPSSQAGHSHAIITSDRNSYPPIVDHNEQSSIQPAAPSGARPMSDRSYSTYKLPDASLDSSLLCSPWPPVRASKPPAPTSPTEAMRDGLFTGVGFYDRPQENRRHQSTDPVLPQIHPVPSLSSSNTSLNGPTPVLTPITTAATCLTPATTINDISEGKLAEFPQIEPQQGPDKYRTIQPALPRPPSQVQDIFSDFSFPGTSLLENADNPFASAPEWPSDCPVDFPENQLADPPHFKPSDFDIPLSMMIDTTTVDGNGMGDFTNLFDMDGSVGPDPSMPLTFPDPPNELEFSSFVLNSDPPSDISMPLTLFGDNTESLNHGCLIFNPRPYTSHLGAENMVPLGGAFPQPPLTVASTAQGEGSRRNTDRDNELIALRAQGLSYRNIKQHFGFSVAESTLRGRIRSLTKSKEERLRKPTWKSENIRLLCSCVIESSIQQGLCSDVVSIEGLPILKSEQSIGKVSWKKVAQEMADRGSYHYGNATVKKKYMDLRKEQLTRRS